MADHHRAAVLDGYARESATVRLHAWLRWRSCPLVEVLAHVPSDARSVLELGCGYGLVSLLAAAAGHHVVGIDVDADRIAVAARAAARLGLQIRFEVNAVPPVPAGPWDCILMVDLLYLLAPDEQDRLLRQAARVLAPGGSLVCKDMAPTPLWKARWDRLQETLAVRVLRLTSGGGVHPEPPDRRRAVLEAAGLTVVQRPVDQGYPHPHHLVVATRAAGPPVGATEG